MFELAAQGYNSPFEQLISCIISIRTYDEVSLPTAKRLFDHARTPDEMIALSVAEIDRLSKKHLSRGKSAANLGYCRSCCAEL